MKPRNIILASGCIHVCIRVNDECEGLGGRCGKVSETSLDVHPRRMVIQVFWMLILAHIKGKDQHELLYLTNCSTVWVVILLLKHKRKKEPVMRLELTTFALGKQRTTIVLRRLYPCQAEKDT